MIKFFIVTIFQGHAFILVYSVSSRQSLEELKPIWQTIKEIKGTELPNIPVMLAGNKCDESPEIREVPAAEGQAQAQTWGVSFMETSAKTNHNVTQLFQVKIFSCCFLCNVVAFFNLCFNSHSDVCESYPHSLSMS